ncbi:hypothetical protein [Endomicrobium proavitum]|uniref:Outer membrane protein beta-barrel domain-containing protein n=1 Tax=Endomicrobium proavitum TaxID=1408281 RepID=A0A0G3WK44_9BACT|nr:hypothetical protein [Endomicrobium proavitum]AKL98252.1 membrane protein of unknown function [Endomicrobium proavitum]
MKKIASIFYVMLFCVSFSYAEYIYLSSGEVVEGKITAESNSGITVKVGAKNRKIKISEIIDITKTKKIVVTAPVQVEAPAAPAEPEIAAVAPVKVDQEDFSAKTQFTSDASQPLEGSQTYVSDYNSGSVIYNVKAVEVPKPPEEPEQVPDAQPWQPEVSAEPAAPQDEASAVVQEPEAAASVEDDGFDAAAFLLGEAAVSIPQAPPVADNEPEPVKPVKEKAKYETFVGVAFDLKGQFDSSGKEIIGAVAKDLGKENTDYGFSVAIERYGYFLGWAALGVGVSYEFNRHLEKTPGTFSFLPVYATLKLKAIDAGWFTLYGLGQAGYSFMFANNDYIGDAKSRGGLYYAFGGGISVGNVVLQALYSVSSSHLSRNLTAADIDKDVKFSKLGAYIGYLF